MIRDPEGWRKWEIEWQRRNPVSIDKSFEILELLIEQARLLKKWPPENPLEGIEVDIKIARAINRYVKEYSD